MPSIRQEEKTVVTIGVRTLPSWITLIKEYIEHGNIPPNSSEETFVNMSNSGYTIIGGNLYKIGLSTLMLRCLEKDEGSYALIEVHIGIIGKYMGFAALAKKLLIAGYVWWTMAREAQDYVKKCN